MLPHGLGQVDALLDQPAVRRDVQAPLAELVDLALLLADHHCCARLSHPVDLPVQLDLLLARQRWPWRSLQLLQLGDAFVPVFGDQVVHPHAGYLVDADQHGLAGLPGGGVVLHEVPGHLIQPLVGGDDVVFALEFLLQALLRR